MTSIVVVCTLAIAGLIWAFAYSRDLEVDRSRQRLLQAEKRARFARKPHDAEDDAPRVSKRPPQFGHR